MGFNLKVLRVLKFLLGLGYGMGDGKLVYPEGGRVRESRVSSCQSLSM